MKQIFDHDEFITTQELNKLTEQNFIKRLKQVPLGSKNDIAHFVTSRF